MNVFVGNLSREITDDDLRKLFEAFGEVASANVIRDKFSGQARGFGFVEMSEKASAQTAIAELNGKDVKGRAINVNEARPRSDSRGGDNRGGGGGRRPGGGGDNRGGGGRRRAW